MPALRLVSSASPPPATSPSPPGASRGPRPAGWRAWDPAEFSLHSPAEIPGAGSSRLGLDQPFPRRLAPRRSLPSRGRAPPAVLRYDHRTIRLNHEMRGQDLDPVLVELVLNVGVQFREEEDPPCRFLGPEVQSVLDVKIGERTLHHEGRRLLTDPYGLRRGLAEH